MLASTISRIRLPLCGPKAFSRGDQLQQTRDLMFSTPAQKPLPHKFRVPRMELQKASDDAHEGRCCRRARAKQGSERLRKSLSPRPLLRLPWGPTLVWDGCGHDCPPRTSFQRDGWAPAFGFRVWCRCLTKPASISGYCGTHHGHIQSALPSMSGCVPENVYLH